MSWTAIVLVVVQFLGPLLLKWLEDLLKEAARDLERTGMPPSSFTPALADLRLWLRAADKLSERGRAIYWWNLWGLSIHKHREKQFRQAMIAAGQRYGQFYRAAMGQGEPVPLADQEMAEIVNPPEW